MRHTEPAPARCLLLALLLAGGAAGAQTSGPVDPAGAPDAELPEVPRYAVEIILFRYGEGVPAGNERFLPEPAPLAPPYAELPYPPADASTQPGEPGFDAAVPEYGDLPPAARTGGDPAADVDLDDGELPPLEEIVLPTSRVGLEVMPREALTLGSLYDKLETLDAYEPVLWAGWIQDTIERELSPEIPLRRLGSAPPQFDGNLTLYLSRFLHLVVDLTLTSRPASPYPGYGDPYAGTGGAGQYPGAGVPTYGDGRNEFGIEAVGLPDGTVRMRIDEDRIVKNGDLRYFDHPRFGLLAKVSRVESGDAATEDESGDDTDVLLPPVEQ